MSHSSALTRQSRAPLDEARMARIPWASLRALSALRHREDVRVEADGEWAWVAWEPAGRGARDEVVEALLPVPRAVFFRRQGEHWHRVGRRLPEFGAGPPGGIAEAGMPLHRVLVPEPIRGEAARTAIRSSRLAVVQDDRPRPASALIVTAAALLSWAESAPTARLRELRASRSGDRVLLIGQRLPPMAGLGRYWGARVLLPIGHRAEPDLPEARLAEAVALADGEIGIIGLDANVEVVPAGALMPLSRASARRMAGIVDRLPGPAGQGGGA